MEDSFMLFQSIHDSWRTFLKKEMMKVKLYEKDWNRNAE